MVYSATVKKCYFFVKELLKICVNMENVYVMPWLDDSVGWASSCKPRGHQFDSRTQHVPGLPARSPVGGVWEATNQFLSLPLSFPSPLSRNK